VTIDGASPLHQALYDAIAACDAEAFDALVRERMADVRAAFDDWARVPATIRDDDAAVARYVNSLITIGRTFDAMGVPDLLARLTGPDATNPIVQWNRRVSEAQARSDAGDYAESSRILLGILAEIDRVTGSAVAALRPKILGRLGFDAVYMERYEAALGYTAAALDAAAASGDREGVRIYFANLQALRVVHAMSTDPARGQRLLAMRRLVTRAQDAADGGRYRASLELLSQAETIAADAADDDLVQALQPKILGLRGFNEHRLGDAASARRHTSSALQQSRSIGDLEGVRIYTANLEALDGPAATA
jgi:hypothetical protein